jgi:hypothetical protein
LLRHCCVHGGLHVDLCSRITDTDAHADVHAHTLETDWLGVDVCWYYLLVVCAVL